MGVGGIAAIEGDSMASRVQPRPTKLSRSNLGGNELKPLNVFQTRLSSRVEAVGGTDVFTERGIAHHSVVRPPGFRRLA